MKPFANLYAAALLIVLIALQSCSGGNGTSNSDTGTNLYDTVFIASPTGVAAIAGDREATISWNPVFGATIYNIYWATASGVSKTAGAKISNVSSPFVHTGLSNSLTYHYVVTAGKNNLESAESSEATASPFAPPGFTSPLTKEPANLMDNAVTMNGSLINPIGYTTTVWFEYGTTTSYGNATSQTIYAAVGPLDITANLSGLLPATTYHHRLVTQNAGGIYNGSDKSFKTYAQPLTIATGLDAPASLIVDSSYVYFTETYAGTVSKVPKNGVTVTTLASGLTQPGSIALDSNSVYFGEFGALKKVGVNGGTVTTLAAVVNSPAMLRLDSSDIYWAENDIIKKVDINGGAIANILTGVAVNAFTTDPTSLYYIESGYVKKINKDGSGSPIFLTADVKAGGWLALGGSTLYFSVSDSTAGNAVKKVDVSGGAVSTVVSVSSNITYFTMDSGTLYWSEFYEGSVKKVDIAAGEITTLAVGQSYAYLTSGPIVSATDATDVYWIMTGNHFYPPLGSINKTPK